MVVPVDTPDLAANDRFWDVTAVRLTEERGQKLN
jgi:hypothetical protein